MSNLIKSAYASMTSREIAELVDSRHDDVKRSIERLAIRGVIVQPPMADEPGTDSMGRNRTASVYVFSGEKGKRDSIIVVAQLSPEFTARLVDRWQELENQQQFKVPQTLPEALRLAADLADQVQQQQVVIEHQKPAVDFVQRYTTADTGNMGFREVCKLFGLSESWMRWFFKEKTIMYKLAGNWVPYTQHLGTGRFSMKAGVADHESGKSHAYTHSKFTPKGVKWLAGLIYEHRLEHENIGTNQGGLEL